MRISDWSSDVCSSDLRPMGRSAAAPVPAPLVRNRRRAHQSRRARRGPISDPRQAQVPRVAAEIGRASCRERVCQYVSISVVAVSLKKQTTTDIYEPTKRARKHLVHRAAETKVK